MRNIEIEIELKDQEEGQRLTERLLNGSSYVGRKHGKWILFITCPTNEILHLGQELYYELTD